MSRTARIILAVWLLSALASLAALWHLQPHGPLKWALWAVAGLPVLLAVNVIAELIVVGFLALPGIRHMTARVEKRAEGRALSGLRLAWYAAVALVAVALVATVMR